MNPWTVALQAPWFLEFSRQDYCSGFLPFPFPGDLPNPETEPESPASQANPLPSGPPGKPNKVQYRPKLSGQTKGTCGKVSLEAASSQLLFSMVSRGDCWPTFSASLGLLSHIM